MKFDYQIFILEKQKVEDGKILKSKDRWVVTEGKGLYGPYARDTFWKAKIEAEKAHNFKLKEENMFQGKFRQVFENKKGKRMECIISAREARRAAVRDEGLGTGENLNPNPYPLTPASLPEAV